MKPPMPKFLPPISLFGPMCLLLGLLLGGCTPKRVVNNEIFTGPVGSAPTPARTPAQAGGSDAPRSTDLPATQPATKAGFGRQVADLARRQLGKMYQWGGNGPDRFDCSGLVYFVYGSLGVDLPRVSEQQARRGGEVDRKDLSPGDMLYFATSGPGIDHVGIYLGDDKFIHAPRRGIPVRTDSLHNGWWRQKFRGARRFAAPSP